MKRALWLAALTCIAAAAATPARAADYVRVRFLPSNEPALYCQFDEGTLRVAATAEGLAKAEPVKADHVSPLGPEDGARLLLYSNVALPAPPPGASGAVASFQVVRFTPRGMAEHTQVHGSFSISVAGAGRGTWTYVATAFSATTQEERAASPQTAPVLVIGDLSHPVLTIEPQVKGRDVGIAIRLWTGAPRKATEAEGGREVLVPSDTATSVQSLQRNGKPARVHLQVIAASGKTIKSEDGDLGRFGFG
jgi:hypothetical protein